MIEPEINVIYDNFIEINLQGIIRLWFSYQTIIAFSFKGNFYCSENIWTKTTGKHLNRISDKKNRLDNDTFTIKLHNALKEIRIGIENE